MTSLRLDEKMIRKNFESQHRDEDAWKTTAFTKALAGAEQGTF
jgi:hypothetical protein